MEPLHPDLVAALRKHIQISRIIAFALCFGAPMMYLFLLVRITFHGDFGPMLAGFHGVPWGDLRVIVLCSLSVATLAGAPLISAMFWGRANRATTTGELLGKLRTGHIILCALLESVAIYGLVLGFLIGPGAGPLCLLMILVPPLGYLLLIPGSRSWMRLISLRAKSLPGGRGPGDKPGDKNVPA